VKTSYNFRSANISVLTLFILLSYDKSRHLGKICKNITVIWIFGIASSKLRYGIDFFHWLLMYKLKLLAKNLACD